MMLTPEQIAEIKANNQRLMAEDHDVSRFRQEEEQQRGSPISG
jgi:hypothetical protein